MSVDRALIGQPKHAIVVVAITALRAALAYGIGFALLSFGRGEEAVIGFMGLYWLVSGLFSLAWARKGPFLQHLSLLAGVVGVATGSLFVLYSLFGGGYVPAGLVVVLVAAVIGVTGLLHVLGGSSSASRWTAGREAMWCSV